MSDWVVQWLIFLTLAPLALAFGVGFLRIVGEVMGAWGDRIAAWAKRKERMLNAQQQAKRRQTELDERRAEVRELLKEREKQSHAQQTNGK